MFDRFRTLRRFPIMHKVILWMDDQKIVAEQGRDDFTPGLKEVLPLLRRFPQPLEHLNLLILVTGGTEAEEYDQEDLPLQFQVRAYLQQLGEDAVSCQDIKSVVICLPGETVLIAVDVGSEEATRAAVALILECAAKIAPVDQGIASDVQTLAITLHHGAAHYVLAKHQLEQVQGVWGLNPSIPAPEPPAVAQKELPLVYKGG